MFIYTCCKSYQGAFVTGLYEERGIVVATTEEEAYSLLQTKFPKFLISEIKITPVANATIYPIYSQ